MDSKSIDLLEFDRVKEIVAGFASFSASRELVLGLQPQSDFERISLLLQQSAEARHLLALEPTFSLGGVTDIRPLVAMAAKGKVLEPRDLLAVQNSVAALNHLRQHMARFLKETPLLWDIAAGITAIPFLPDEIATCISPAGDILDSASPKLSTTRNRLRQDRKKLLERLQNEMETQWWGKIIQEPIITEREGRYVIPVKHEHRHEVQGVVHDVSNTGSTLFVEPWAVVEMGNTLRELAVEEKHEVERILAKLSADIGAHAAELSRNVDLAAGLDLALAKARYAARYKAIEPVIVPDSAGELRLIDARHPLLGEKAVPQTIELGGEFRILVITGPNTGGKTVALKTAGILSLMALAGIPVPAHPDSRIPLFDGVFADIGDEQSISQTLSTFSWHITNITRILQEATGRSLVLLDELGTSTDPAEGSALARAILDYLLQRGTLAIVTSHYGELKAFAHNTPGLRNASLEFDPVTLAPTYHIRLGTPGGSNALATAARLGLPAEIINDARGLLSKGALELEKLLADLAQEKQSAQVMRLAFEQREKELTAQAAELEKERTRARSEVQRVVQEARDIVVREAAELQREIRQAAAELRRDKSRDKVQHARKVIASVAEGLKSAVWQAEESPVETSLCPGDTVRLKEVNVLATVLAVSEASGQIEVQAGKTRLSLNLSSVEKVIDGAAPPAEARPSVQTAARNISRELDLRGRRVDETQVLLEKYLDSAAVAGVNQVRIIHGFGTGAVRSVVRDLLSASPLVKSFRAGERGEGGDGVTVVNM